MYWGTYSNKVKKGFFSEWSVEHSFSLLVYLIFVWGMAYVRRDYLWIVGDDPNLLMQSILMSKGFIPNVDFFSGYPGLSIQLQALIVKLFGVHPISEHIYSAFLATLLGIVLFFLAKNVKPFLLLLFLMFIYAQGLFLNPTPNPGFLFVIAFIIGLKKTINFLKFFEIKEALWSGVFFGIAFLAKQYGVFGPIGFFITSIMVLKVSPPIKKTMFVASLVIFSGMVLITYFQALIPGNNQHDTLVSNSLLFISPMLVGLFLILTDSGMSADKSIPLSGCFRANIIMITAFSSVIIVYFFSLYGMGGIVDSMREIMLLAPNKINGIELLPVTVSKASLYALCALIILYIPFISLYYFPGKYDSLINYAMIFMLTVLLFKYGNISATPFMTIAYIIFLGFIFSLRCKIRLGYLITITVGFSPFLLILIPYPNYSYHIPVLIFLILIFYEQVRSSFFYKTKNPTNRCYIDKDVCLLTKFLPSIVTLLLTAGIIFHEANRIDKYQLYNFEKFEFKSGDARWENRINEAIQVKDGMKKCATNACRYLLLTMPGFNNYGTIIEKPIISNGI